MSVAFTKEESAETASETLLPDRPISSHPNLVTEAGLRALEFQLQRAREAYETAQKIEDVNERRRQAAAPSRDVRYLSARVRTAQVITNPTSTDAVAFGSTVTVRRDDGRVQKYHIVGKDEALKTDANNPNPLIYANVRSELSLFSVVLPPAAAVAGVYATVESPRERESRIGEFADGGDRPGP